VLIADQNMIKRLTFLGILILLQVTASAQSLSGFIHDAKGTPVSGASVYLLNTNYNTSSNGEGKFSINKVSNGQYTIQINAFGYATLVKDVTVERSGTNLNLQLITSDKQLDEVIVTAQKRDEDPQKLALSVTSFSAKQVEDHKLWNIKDITALVPNLYSASPGDNRNVTSIRGITTTSYDPTVATYVDGVNQFGLDTYIAQLADIERIEVLRGPQGTLYGRNAMGGVINIITKQPTNDAHGFVELGYGNFHQQRYNVGLRTPLVKDKLFLGISGLFTKQTGFYTNLFNGSKFDDQHSVMGNYYLKYLPSQKLSLTLNVKHVENRNNGAFPLSSDPVTALSLPFLVDQNNNTTLIDNIFNASLSLQYSGKAFNFTSQSSYQSDYRYYTNPIDGDFSAIDGVSLINNYGDNYNKVKVGTQEFRFSSPASSGSALKWIAGTYSFYQDNPVKQGTHFGADAVYVGAPFPDFTSLSTNLQNRIGWAAFGQATYTLSSQFDITAGLRFDYEHVKQSVKGEFQMDGQPSMVTRADTSSSANFKAFSPKLGLEFHISSANNLYVVYSRGFRTGGISQLSSDPSQPPLYAYAPESSNNFEIGTKNDLWNNHARLNIVVFYTSVNDAQVPTLILPDAITVTRNAGKLTSKGAELELALKPLKGVELDYNLGYTHARYTALNVASNGSEVNLNGNNQVFTPDVTSMLGLRYNYTVSQGYKLVARGEWRYLGDQYFDLANQIKQSAYSLFNSRLGLSARKFDLFVWGSNLFNKHYIDYAYDFGAAHLGNPKTFGAGIKANF